MSPDIANIDASHDHESQQTQTTSLNVPLILALTGALIGLLLATYTRGYILAIQTATQRPPAEARSLKQNFRGLPIYITHRLIKIFILSWIPIQASSPWKCSLLNISVDLLLSNLKVANIHAIMGVTHHSRSHLPYYRHISTWSTWTKTFPAFVLYSLASSACFYIPVHFVRLAGTLEVSENMHIIFMLASVVILYFGAVVPTWTIFLRIAASNQENGSIKSAWQGFPWPARLQFFKLLGEVFVLETGVCIVLFVFVLAHLHPELHDDVLQFFVKYFG